MGKIRIKAYAKINLAIDMLGILENGYHEVRMIMQQIELHDEVLVRTFGRSKGDKSRGLTVEISTNKPFLPTDNRNLAYRAAELMVQKYRPKWSGKIRIDIKKNIPVAAGLAGGSSNAAAVILGLNHLWNLDLSLDELCENGKTLGADIPFCIRGQAGCNDVLKAYLREDKNASGCCEASYDGTQLKSLPGLESWVVLSKPPISVQTAEVYRGMDEIEIQKHPDIDEMIEGLAEKNRKKVSDNMINVLELYTVNRYSIVKDTKKAMSNETGVEDVLMSGSGPTVFGLCSSEEAARKIRSKMKKINRESFYCMTTR